MSLHKPVGILDVPLHELHGYSVREIVVVILQDGELSKLLGKAIANAPLHSDIITYDPILMKDVEIEE